MKVFISHASVDRELVTGLVDLLQLGAGISHHDIFCSSVSGSIPNGASFVQHILSNLQTADLVVAVLSRSYFRSDFCAAEAGAAQVRQLAGTAIFYSLLVPPVDFPDLDGVLHGVQSSRILDQKALDGLRDRASKGMATPPPTSTWNDKRDTFLKAIADKVNRQIGTELLRLITVQDVYPARSTDPTITYKSKLRVVLRNDTGEDLDAKAPTWIASTAWWPMLAVLSDKHTG